MTPAEKRSSLLQRTIRAAGSAKLAAVLMAVLALMAFGSVLVPQEAFLPVETLEEFRSSAPELVTLLEALGLTSIFTGWVFALTVALLAVNVTVCTLRRISRSRRGGSAVVESSGLPRPLEKTAANLQDEGWSVRHSAGGRVMATKGRSGFWGSILMHAGLLVIMAGGLAATQTSLNGAIVITEGQTVVDSAQAYESVATEPQYGTAFTGAAITLESMSVRYEDGERVSVLARMSAVEASGRRVSDEVTVNHPFIVDGTAYVLRDSGFAPSIILDRDGELDTRVVALAAETPYGWSDSLRVGEVRRGGAGALLEMQATPVPLFQGETMPVESLDIRDPRLAVRLVDAAGLIGEGVLAPGESLTLADGFTVTFEDLFLWNRFMVRRAPARWVLYAGFWMCVIGSAWRLLVPERRLGVRVIDEGHMRVAYRVWPIPLWSFASDEKTVARLQDA